MLVFVIFFLSSCQFVEMALDLNCTQADATGTIRLAPSAIRGCQDLYPFGVCQQMFGAGIAYTATTEFDATIGRSSICYTIANIPTEELKRASIIACPLFCGFCCVAPSANCPNAPAPRIDCNTITDDMCDSILWRELIASDCPSACGFCLLGGCIDAAPDCVTQPTICANTAMAEFTQVNCRRTCNLCDTASCGTTSSGTISSTVSSCTDSSNSCSLWNRNGFCSSAFYSDDQKRNYCASTCSLC